MIKIQFGSSTNRDGFLQLIARANIEHYASEKDDSVQVEDRDIVRTWANQWDGEIVG